MTATMIVIGTPAPDGAEARQAYVNGTKPLLQTAGMTAVTRYDIRETLVGDGAPGMVAAVDFPSGEAVRGFINSPEYQKLVPLREKAFASIQILISETA